MLKFTLAMMLLSSTFLLYGQNIQVYTLIPDIDASGGMTSDASGNLYVSDFGPALGQVITNAKVYKIDQNDFSISVFAEGFSGASGSCFDANGNFYQSNPHGHKVSKISADGAIDLDWASSGLQTPIGIISNSQDELFVCNCGGNNISTINAAGEVELFATSSLFNCPNGLTVDDNDNLYACNYSDGKVLKITPSGEVSEVVTLPILTSGNFTIGNGHLTYLHGFLFVNTIGTGQVFKVSLTGESEAIAGAAFGFGGEDGAASSATFSKPNGIITSVTGDTLFINESEPTWPSGGTNLHPGRVRMITGICSLPDVDCGLTPEPDMRFTEVTDGAIVNRLNLSMGSSWADYNQDGHVDLVVMTGNDDNLLYKNNGNGTFTSVNNIVSSDGGNSSAAIWGDYDNDGDLDLYVSNNPAASSPAEANFLYQNSGAPDFNFAKITTESPVVEANHTWSSSWVDYDNDGDLDLHVPENRHIGRDYFFENNGTADNDGNYFTTVLREFITPIPESTGSSSWMDYDNDGDQDLFLFKSGRSSAAGKEDHRMFHNNLIETENLDFQEIVTNEMLHHLDLDFQASWGDYDNDGDMDVYLGNFDNSNYLYQNNGDSLFTRITTGALVTDNTRTLGSTWGDFDNDGDLDLYVTNAGQAARYYENDGTGTFSRRFATQIGTAASNISNTQSCSTADFNNDGYLDIFVGNAALSATQLLPDFLYQNNGGSNGYLLLNCQGKASNWSGIGTKIRLKATINGQSVWQMRIVSGSPTGDRAQNSLRQHFGLGNATIIDSLVVEWTSGQKDIYSNLNINQICTLVEGESNDCLMTSPVISLPDFIQSFSIAPNPIQDDSIFIQYEVKGVSKLTFSLFDLKGRLLQQIKTGNDKQLNWRIGKLPAGTYLLELATSKGRIAEKVVIL